VSHSESDFGGDELYRLLFEQVGTALVAADMQGVITAWNRAAVRFFGAAASEMLNSDWTHLFPVESRDRVSKTLRRCLDSGSPGEFEFSLRNEHGEPQRLAVIVTPLASHSGQRIGAVMAVRDITNRMVLQDKLSQKRKMAALGELAGAFSHQFNNILGGIVTSVDFALGSHDFATMQRVMHKTQGGLNRASHLVEELLLFAEGSHRDAGLCDLGEVIAHRLDVLERRLRDLPITLDVRMDPIPAVEVPTKQITTVFENLIQNAIDAMPAGGKLSVALHAENDWAIVSIADTGVGLDPKVVPRIFEPFFSTKRGHETDKSSRGLGLAVAHGAIGVLGGHIDVHSILGEGSVFEMRIPLNP